MRFRIRCWLLVAGALGFRDEPTYQTLDALSDGHGYLGSSEGAAGGSTVTPSSLVGSLQQAAAHARVDSLQRFEPIVSVPADNSLDPQSWKGHEAIASSLGEKLQLVRVEESRESRSPDAQIVADQTEIASLLAQDASKNKLKKVQEDILSAPGSAVGNKYDAILAFIHSVMEGAGTGLTAAASFRRLNPPAADVQQGRSGARIYAHAALGLLVKSLTKGELESLESLSIEDQLKHYLEKQGNTLLSMNLLILEGSNSWLVSTLVGPVEGVHSFDLKGTLMTMTCNEGAQGLSKHLTYGKQADQGDQQKFVDLRERSPGIFDALNAAEGIAITSVLQADATWLVEQSRVDFSLLVKVRRNDTNCSLESASPTQPSIQDLALSGVCVDEETRVWMGIIDYLGKYTWKKASESLVKWAFLGLTTVCDRKMLEQRTIRPPKRYATRFTTDIPELLFGDVKALRERRQQLGAK